jgi:triosephosphate isomerase
MNKTASEACAFVERLAAAQPSSSPVVVGVAPPFTALERVGEALVQVPWIQLGAQNCHWEDAGAFTGEVSLPMLKDLGCRFVLIGHSERRHLFAEQDETINKKVQAALRHGLQPILCVGETLLERDAGDTGRVVTQQLSRGLQGIGSDQLRHVALAYEPVWAIGTGRAATPTQAVEVHRQLRASLREIGGENVAAEVPILYGGSVTPDNVIGFLGSDEVDGALVGGACLKVESFATIIRLSNEIFR